MMVGAVRVEMDMDVDTSVTAGCIEIDVDTTVTAGSVCTDITVLS